MLFRRLTVHGRVGSILWGHRTAATVGTWTIWRRDHDGAPSTWELHARATRADAFQCRQGPLLFVAPRDKGMWCWGVESLTLVGLEVRAQLGPPEQ